MKRWSFAGWLAWAWMAVCPWVSPLHAEEAAAEDSPVDCTIRPGEVDDDGTRVVFRGTIGSMNVWMALRGAPVWQLAGSYLYEKHGKPLGLAGCITPEGRFRLEERVEGQLTGVMIGSRQPEGKLAISDEPTLLTGDWISPDGERRLPFSLWEHGSLPASREGDLVDLEPVPADWDLFQAPKCRFAFRYPRAGSQMWHSAPTEEEEEGAPVPECRFHAYLPGDDHALFNIQIAVYRGVEKSAILEKHGFLPLWNTWRVGPDPPDIAAVEDAGRLHVIWAEPQWTFWEEDDGNRVERRGTRSEAIIEDGDRLIFFSSPDPWMRVSQLVRGLLAIPPGRPATLGEFYTFDSTAILDRQEVSARSHTTWRGTYSFTGEEVYRTGNLPDLHVIHYSRFGEEGDLINLAMDLDEERLVLLREANPEIPGLTPIFDGFDLFPGDDGAEVILRWREPGHGGVRTVEKYRYGRDGLTTIDRAALDTVNRQLVWSGGFYFDEFRELRSTWVSPDCGFRLQLPPGWTAAPSEPGFALKESCASGLKPRGWDRRAELSPYDLPEFAIQIEIFPGSLAEACEKASFCKDEAGSWQTAGRAGMQSPAEAITSEAWDGVRGESDTGLYWKGGGYVGAARAFVALLDGRNGEMALIVAHAAMNGLEDEQRFINIVDSFRFESSARAIRKLGRSMAGLRSVG